MDTFQAFWQYHSETSRDRRAGTSIPSGLKPQALVDDYGRFFQIAFVTDRYRPSHVLTLRTSVDGWSRDVHGVYWWGAWRFALSKIQYAGGCQFRFYLNGLPQKSAPQVLSAPQDTFLIQDSIEFDEPVAHFLHGYENLRAKDDEQQQNLVRSNFSEAQEWDVIIIGSGMGGGVLADALTDYPKDIKVLVLDAGSLDYPSHVDNLPVTGLSSVLSGNQVRHYENIDEKQRFGEFVQMGLGGRSVYWSGLIPRMRAWELNHWPQSVADYLAETGYTAAEKLMRKHVSAGRFQEKLIEELQARFPSFTVVNTPRSCHQPEFGAPETPHHAPESFLHRSTGTFSTVELLLDSMTSETDPGRGKLFINMNHLVTRLKTDGERVTGVICQDLVGNCERTYQGKTVVLAAGSLESVKIALNSKLKDPEKLIGKGLTDHPSYYAPDGFFGGKPFPLQPTSPFAGPYRHARVFFYPDNPWEGYWFNVEIVLNGQYWRSRHADDEVLNRLYPPDVPTTVTFKVVFGTPIQEENTVQLGADPNGRLRVRHAPNPIGTEARPAVIRLLKELIEFFQVQGPVDFSSEGNCHFGNGGTVNHAGATLRMPRRSDKPEEQKSVVDENLRFKGYTNLYVCDPSVYPYIPAANPSLTLAALALRLADHLSKEF